MRASILVVDDEPQMVDIVSFALETHGYTVATAADAESAWAVFRHGSFDLAVLDVMLPGGSGVELCRRIRAAGSVPVILLTARSSTQDRIAGLEAGADDYVTKPFHPRELALRVEAILRRTSGASPRRQVGELVIEPTKVTFRGTILPLTVTERCLLMALAENVDGTVSSAVLVLAGWQLPEGPGTKDMLKTAMYRLRRHLGQAGVGCEILAVRGRGYSLVRDPTTSSS